MNIGNDYDQMFESFECRKKESVEECLKWMENMNFKLELVTREKIELSNRLRNCEQRALPQYEQMRSMLLTRDSRFPMAKHDDYWHLAI
jgi:hypothetical protein